MNNNVKKTINPKTSNGLNSGLTSPGTIDNEMECTGLNFFNTNSDYDDLTFQTCLNKFEKDYYINEITFNNLMKNLPYTFSSLNSEQKKKYLDKLEDFITKVKDVPNKKENFQNNKQHYETLQNSNNDNCSDSNFNLSGVLAIIIMILIIIIFVMFITKK